MPDLKFDIVGIEAVPYAATPMLAVKVRITNAPHEESIHSIILRCQVHIEPTKRKYAAGEQTALHDLFGEPERWGRTVRSMLWMNTAIFVPAFTSEITVDLQLPCTFDFSVASTKYFHALEGGDIPLNVMFSGTVFYEVPDAPLQVMQIPWDREAPTRIPIVLWRKLMDDYYPNSAWLNLRRDVFERLYAYKVQHGIPTLELALERLMRAEDREAEAVRA